MQRSAPTAEIVAPQFRSHVSSREKHLLSDVRRRLLGKRRKYAPRFDVFEDVVSLLLTDIVTSWRVRLPCRSSKSDNDETRSRRGRRARD